MHKSAPTQHRRMHHPPCTNASTRTLTRAHMYASTCTHTCMHPHTHTTQSTYSQAHIIMYASITQSIYTQMYASTHTIHNRGDSQVGQKGGVSACAWLDRKVVMSMFGNTQPSSTGSVLRRQKDHTCTPVHCLESIVLYNKYMGGVDRGD